MSRVARTFWLDGENKGKPVKDTPVKVSKSYKLDPAAGEAARAQRELEALGNVGWLQTQEEYFEAMAQMKRGERIAAELVQKHPMLVANQRPSKWPMRILVATMVALFATVLVLAWHVSRIPYPSLPAASASVSEAPEAPRRAPRLR